eukprot:scaffold1336_cov379-Prasinococcus_capsulatus_cf.AAC.7
MNDSSFVRSLSMTPGVSRNTIWLSSSDRMPRMRCLVVWGCSSPRWASPQSPQSLSGAHFLRRAPRRRPRRRPQTWSADSPGDSLQVAPLAPPPPGQRRLHPPLCARRPVAHHPSPPFVGGPNPPLLYSALGASPRPGAGFAGRTAVRSQLPVPRSIAWLSWPCTVPGKQQHHDRLPHSLRGGESDRLHAPEPRTGGEGAAGIEGSHSGRTSAGRAPAAVAERTAARQPGPPGAPASCRRRRRRRGGGGGRSSSHREQCPPPIPRAPGTPAALCAAPPRRGALFVRAATAARARARSSRSSSSGLVLAAPHRRRRTAAQARAPVVAAAAAAARRVAAAADGKDDSSAARTSSSISLPSRKRAGSCRGARASRWLACLLQLALGSLRGAPADCTSDGGHGRRAGQNVPG